MPKSVFTDAEPKVFELLKGDCLLEVIGCEFEIQNGGKTSGSEKMSITLKGTQLNDPSKVGQIWESFIFHPSCEWKLDLFAKAMNLLIDGRPPKKGEEIDWTEYLVVGLRGYGTVGTRIGNDKKEYNEVKAWITNKEKLSKVIDLAPAEATNDPHADADEFDRA